MQQLLPYANGTPSDDTLRRFFRRIDPKAFQERFAKWAESLTALNKKLVSIDGKISRLAYIFNEVTLALFTLWIEKCPKVRDGDPTTKQASPLRGL